MAGKYSLSKQERLRRSTDFQAVAKVGHRLQAQGFILYIRENGLEHNRLGVSVSKRLAASVGRNRMKRLVREFFRLNKGSFSPPADLLVVCRRGPAGYDLCRVTEELGAALQRGMEALHQG